MATDAMMESFPGQGIGTEAFQDSVARSLLGPEGAVQDEIATEQPWLDGDELREATNEALTADDLNVDRRDEYELTPADEARAEFQAEQTKQFIEQEEAAAEAAAHEQAYAEALEHYDELPPEEQAEVSLESVGRGYEQAAALVNPEQAQILADEVFAGQVDPVPTATLLAFWGKNALETYEATGLTEVTPEQAKAFTDPRMADLFAAGWTEATGLEVADPMDFASTMFRHAPLLLSGIASDLVPLDHKQAFAADLCRVHGEAAVGPTLPPEQAADLYDRWAKWGARLGAGLRAHRQQAGQQQQAHPHRETRTRSSPQTRSKLPRMRTNTDLFDQEALERYNTRL